MIEVLKQALEALEECRRDPRLKYEHPTLDKVITSLRQAIAEAEKQCQYPNCDYPCMDLPDCQEQETEALHQAFEELEAQPKVEKQEPEAAPVAKNEGGRITWMIDDWPQNCLLYTHPQPKREWVTLEPQDMPDGEEPMYDHPFFIAGMVWAANELKEKNT
jgi:hypothetical protein